MEACPSSWCHQVLRTTHDESIERISQLVSLDRKTLPLSAHIYRKKKPNKTEENSPVIIRYLSETKFSFEYEICLAKEGMNKNIEVEIQKKNLSKKTGKELKKLSVGERVSFDIEKILEKKLRIKLK